MNEKATYDELEIKVLALEKQIIECRRTEEDLRESEQRFRHLSSRLLKDHEAERRRISRNLHDELGGDLALLKLQCGMVEQKLGKKNLLIEECNRNLKCMDHIIEHVRKL